jgi:hypothetical protein
MSYRILLITLLFGMEAFAKAKFVAHEWGTFTSLVGSNGITQNGMYHEDEFLPNFVHPFGELTGQHTPIFEPDPGDDCGRVLARQLAKGVHKVRQEFVLMVHPVLRDPIRSDQARECSPLMSHKFRFREGLHAEK